MRVGPYRILRRLGVNCKVVSQGAKEMIVHHDQLKIGYISHCISQIIHT